MLTANINTLTVVLIAVFDVGIVTRIVKTILDGMGEDGENTAKKVKNQIKAAIIINCTAALFGVLRGYYGG